MYKAGDKWVGNGKEFVMDESGCMSATYVGGWLYMTARAMEFLGFKHVPARRKIPKKVYDILANVACGGHWSKEAGNLLFLYEPEEE